MTWIDGIGYLAALLLLGSVTLKRRTPTRVLGLLGGLGFVAYGWALGAWPVVVVGLALAVTSALALRRPRTPRPDIAAVALDPDSPFLTDFLGANNYEIQISQPEYHPSPRDTFVRLLTRDGLPAGVLIGEPAGNELLVHLDYVTPAFRNSQIARWLFGPGSGTFAEAGFTRLVANAHTSLHRNYLEIIGFRPEGGSYVLDLPH